MQVGNQTILVSQRADGGGDEGGGGDSSSDS